MRYIVLDTETTGLDPDDGHKIIEIGCIEIENLIPTKNVFHCYLNPERKVSEKALLIAAKGGTRGISPTPLTPCG